MKFLSHSALYLLGLVFLLRACATTVQAQTFSTTLQSTYAIDEAGMTQVRHVFSVTNAVSTEYVTQYAFEAAGDHIQSVSVTSNGKSLDAKVSPQRSKTNISFSFPDKIVGTGQSREFQVSYATSDIATRTGKTIEITIPRLSDPALFSAYSVQVLVPKDFGPPLNPQPADFTTSEEEGKTSLRFTNFGEQTGIDLSFGKEQDAVLSLQYHLQNGGSTKGRMQIAIPADDTYQRVYYDKLDPVPETIESDPDGNWIASYTLDPSEKLDVHADLHVQTQYTPQTNAALLTKKPEAIYTQAQPYWEVNSSAIQKIAKQLPSPESIYNYIVGTLRYNYNQPIEDAKRLGAIGALANPNSVVCSEFTDLFITLARSNGIPARAAIGYAYSTNENLRPVGLSLDVLHTWPEYWDAVTGTWIAVDPTWGQTTGGMDYFHHIDFNRIVFATQGVSSSSPLPAGMYKYDSQASKDIQIQYVDSLPNYKDHFTSKLGIHPRSLFGLARTYTITIQNTSLHASYAVPISVRTSNADGTIDFETRDSFIPLQSQEIPVQLPRKGFLSHGTTTISVIVGGQTFTHELTLQTTLQQLLPYVVIASVVVVCLAICLVITRSLLVPRWRR